MNLTEALKNARAELAYQPYDAGRDDAIRYCGALDDLVDAITEQADVVAQAIESEMEKRRHTGSSRSHTWASDCGVCGMQAAVDIIKRMLS